MDNESQKFLRSTVNRLDIHPMTIYEEINCYNPQSISDTDREAITAIGKLPFDERQKFDYAALLEKKWEVELANRDAFLRLYDLLQTCQDTEKQAVLSKLIQFKNHINRFETFKALRIDWSKFPFDAKAPKEAEAIAGQFNGKVTEWE